MLRPLALSLSLAVMAGPFAHGYDRPEEIDAIVLLGRRLTYSVHRANIRIGELTIDFGRVDSAGMQAIHIRSLLRTTGLVRLFFKLDEEWNVDVGLNDCLPRRVERETVQGNDRQHVVYEIDAGRDQLEIRDLVNGTVRVRTTDSIVLDQYTLFLYYRRNPHVLHELLSFELIEKQKTTDVLLKRRGVVRTNIVPSEKFPLMCDTLKYEKLDGYTLEIFLQPLSLIPLKIILSKVIYDSIGEEEIALYLKSITPL